jgi:hypothetical protein
VLKGDLTMTPLAPLLLSLAEEESTGCLHISDPEGDEALIYFKSGLVYAVSVPGRRPQLGAKLVSSGALTPEALAEALDAQRTELQGWKLGELLVHLGFVDQPVVEAFVREQVHDAVWDLIRWTEGRWRFRKNEKTREDVAPPMTVQELLENLRNRGVEWEAISHVVHGPTAVPVLSARGGGAPETTLDADAWSMLCKIDGERSVAELARDCGYTLFEAGQVLLALVSAGLVDIEEDVEVAPPAPVHDEGDELYGASGVSSALAAALAGDDQDDLSDGPGEEPVTAETPDEPADEIDALARLVSEVAASVRDEETPVVVEETPSQVPLNPTSDDQSFALSIDRVSAALADVLGPAQEVHDPFEVPAHLRIRKTAPKPSRTPERTPETERREALRAAAAAELAAAHALAEALRRGQREADEAAQDSIALADADTEAARLAAQEEAVRLAAEEEATRVAAEEEAARVAAEEEAARIAAEEEAARLAAEEEAARVAAEEEAARIAAEEEAARIAAEEEAARLAAEEEAARVAAEEEAARLAAEEAARIAAEEEAARLAAEEEAARLAAEEAARIAAEEEAARVAAEEEAARVAAEEEAARAAAEEAARIAAEEEAARVAAEEEAARLAAEEELARLAAEEEATRLAEEVARCEDEAWAEYWTREADDLARREKEAADQAVDRGVQEEAERLAAQLRAEHDAEHAARIAEFDAEEYERRSNAAAMLAELAMHVSESPLEPAPAAEAVVPDQVPYEPVDDDEPAELEPVAAVVGGPPRDMADTAALLRELSSLGLEDEPAAPTPPAPRAPARPPAPSASPAKKKKRGLFGL